MLCLCSGIKIVGGKSDEDIHKDYGIFIRRVIPGGLASKEGKLPCKLKT